MLIFNTLNQKEFEAVDRRHSTPCRSSHPINTDFTVSRWETSAADRRDTLYCTDPYICFVTLSCYQQKHVKKKIYAGRHLCDPAERLFNIHVIKFASRIAPVHCSFRSGASSLQVTAQVSV